MFVISIILLFICVMFFGASRLNESFKAKGVFGSFVLAVLAIVCFGLSMFTQVGASKVGIVTTFGKVEPGTLPEGAHFVLPWSRVTEVYLGQQQARAEKSDAGSKDLQSVHADLAVNYTINPGKARELYVVNPALNYNDLIVMPAIYEVFKAAVSKYTAEELITKRQEVSALITAGLTARLAPYHLIIQNVNLLNFGFSKSFDAAIEEKVTASQKAETAKRNLERVKFEAESRIAQAEGEAKAIAIQAAAVDKQGGVGYVQLQAIEKWNGVLPQYVTSGAALPFVNIK
jgi:regulator of protease activity HflC (stomatin/prohibitin superfamily)